ncbi:MAG: putative sulfate exporter family transporter, partial [Clostridiales bacterium]|nr:putative sulfate exporter family transporter [Clostridiales bacterium]
GAALGTVNAIFAFLKKLSKFFIVMAMAAIGLNTDIVKLVKSGGRPILLGFCCWVAIACVSLGMQHVLGLL